MKHVRFRVHVSKEEKRVLMPDEVIDRLLHCNRINHYRAGVDAGNIHAKVRAACVLMAERSGPFASLTGAVPPELIDELANRFDAGSIALTPQEFALLGELIEAAGDPKAFDEKYADRRFDAFELRLYAPIFTDLTTVLVAPVAPPLIPEKEQKNGEDERRV